MYCTYLKVWHGIDRDYRNMPALGWPWLVLGISVCGRGQRRSIIRYYCIVFLIIVTPLHCSIFACLDCGYAAVGLLCHGEVVFGQLEGSKAGMLWEYSSPPGIIPSPQAFPSTSCPSRHENQGVTKTLSQLESPRSSKPTPKHP